MIPTIVQQGERLKYIVTSQNPNFNMEEDDFYLEIIYGMRQQKKVIPKSEFLYGTGGEFVLMFDTDGMIGKITARMVWQCHDTDSAPQDLRQEVDEQVIAFVVNTPRPTMLLCPAESDGHDVRYERTEESDIAAMYMRLCATETVIPETGGEPYNIYRPLITRNDEYIYVLRESTEEIADILSNH